MGDWYLQAIANSIGAFFDLLAHRPSETNPNAWANILTSSGADITKIGPEFFGPLLNRPAGNLDEHSELEFRGGSGARGTKAGSPLVKGLLKISKERPTRSPMSDIQRRKIRLHLFLNPTRFLRHQPTLPITSITPENLLRTKPNFVADSVPKRRKILTEARDTSVETSLDGNDNVLIGRRVQAMARHNVWPTQLERYFRGIEDLIGSEFRRSERLLGLTLEDDQPLSRDHYYALKKVETYFEFSCANPLRTLRKLQPILQSIGLSNKSRDYPNGLSQVASDGNATRIETKLRGACVLKIYAKTTQRLRFEITHDLTKKSASRLLLANSNGYTTRSMEELLQWFPRLARDAARRVNEVLEQIARSQDQVTIEPASVYELLGEIFGSIPNEQRAKDFLKILVENGCIRIGEKGSDFLPEIRHLRRKRVLLSFDGVNRLSPRFHAALNTLRKQDGLSLLKYH